MNRELLQLSMGLFLSVVTLTASAAPARPASSAHSLSAATTFDGAVAEPMGRIKESVTQLRIRFPEEMVKAANTEPFTVTCTPAMPGFSGWADNNTIWTYDFKAKSEYDEARLAGGTKCVVAQATDVVSSAGKTWKSGTINYSVIVGGPNLISAVPAHGFKGGLRETEPVILMTFDGPVNAEKFFSEQNGYLNYLSSNAPSEKMALAPVPKEQAEALFAHFKATDYYEADFKDRTWILATVKQSLIPGAQINLTVEKQTSADNADVQADTKFTKEFSVRSQFQAEVECANPSAKAGSCMPQSPISVSFNGQVKWADIKDAYIEYLPYKSTDKKLVRSFAEISKDHKMSFWDDMIYRLSQYFPYLAKYSDTVLDSVEFNVNIEPQTQAKIVLPKTLTDLDGRLMSNVLTEFYVRIGALDEVVQVPSQVSFFEKNVEGVHLPVGVVNMNQKIEIRKAGTDSKSWQAITDFSAMIRLIRAYDSRGDYRETPNYVSPMEQLQIPSTVVEQKLSGVKNRPTVLQFPFAAKQTTPASGLYAIEISSPSFEKERSDAADNHYFNPKFVLAQVTDLTVHMKKGTSSTLAWVTHLSNAQPAGGAQVEIYNCNGEQVGIFVADAQGLVSFPNKQWTTDCKTSRDDYSSYAQPDAFFVGAKAGGDFALIHSSWTSESGYAMGAPGIDYFDSNVVENEPHYHAVIGVNLVKPGQQVPIELLAKVPDAKGFHEVAPADLPPMARIASSDDEDVYYEFPLTWTNGKAEITWNVPSDSSVRLGRYTIEMKIANQVQTVQSGDIEVAEFKVPLMSGIIAFPNQELVVPASIPVSSVIRYANGVGAKKLNADVSYYFSPTSIQNKDLPTFTFGTGSMTVNDDASNANGTALPSGSRPAILQGLTTGDDGSLVKDLALEPVSDGRTVAEVLKTVDRPQKLVVRVRYQDQVGEFQTLSQAKDIYNSATYIGTNLVSGARAGAKLQAAVVDVQGKNVTSIADLDFKVIRIETRVVGEELFGGLIKNTLERELKPVRWPSTCSMQAAVASCPVGALKEGSYAFEVTSKTSKQVAHVNFKVDGDGRVYGPNDYYNFGDDEGNRQLPLALNKKSYKDGEKAIVSFAAPFKTCRALVSIERSDVITSFVVPDACEKGQVEVPVDATLAPNAFVSVYAITGRAAAAAVAVGEMDLGRPTYRLGFANMKVNWGRFKSKVTVKTNKEKYQPGETVEVAVAVQPEEGQLKAGTVTLIAIEEKILDLKKNDTYSVLDSLMQMRAHSVETITALERIETTIQDNADLPARAGRKGGDEGGDGSSKSEFKRKLFNALVAFQPNVPVDKGVAKFSFKTNDSLTRFKIFAISTDAAQKFGTGEVSYITEQDTQAYANIPPVAYTGDNYPMRVTVQNNSSKDGKFKAQVTTTAKDKNGKVIDTKTCEKEANIEKSGSQAIDVCPMTIADNATQITYVIRIYDENGKLVDVIEPDAQTILPSVPLAIHDSLIAQTVGGKLNKSLVKDAQALAGKGEIRVTASKSLVASALTQIGQRLERDAFSGFFIESRFNQALLRSSEAKPEELKAVLETLVGYTDSSGFVKYYPQAEQGSVYLTASIVNSLQQEPWALKLIPAALSDRLKDGISKVLSKKVAPSYVGKTPMDWMRAQTVMARAAFAFADDQILIAQAKSINTAITEELKRNPNAYGEPVEKWTTQDLVERWLLEVTASPDTALASTVYQQLVGPARLVRSGNQAQLNGAPSFSYTYTDETIETAKLLLGHSRMKADNNLARSLAIGLVNANEKGWYNSSTMISTALALKSFARSYEADVVTGSSLLSVPEVQATATVDFGQKTFGSLTTEWTTDKATVQVTHAGQGQPWVSVQALSAVPLQASRGQGLSIEKSMRNVTRDSVGAGYQAGDIVEVTLKINSSAALKHMALLDPIPAGSNILSDAYGDYSSGQKSYSGYKLYFAALSSGVTTVKFQYQLNNPGTFKMPPTRAEGLYMPSLYAESPNAVLKVQ